MTPAQRVVAIVGRPNVGKSALFNRLVGRRVSIVHAQSGVTRDRLMMESTWNDERFELIDTGGIQTVAREDRRDAIESGIRDQVRTAVADAAVAVLVVDVQSGIVPMDEEVAGFLRKAGSAAFVAVNKCDNEGREVGAADFERLGFPLFPVSALHDRGIGALMDAVSAALPPAENPSVHDPLKVAVVGRPNVGKSSYVNRLLRSDRVIVSDVPGTTRDSVDIPFTFGRGPQARHYLLIDTAGIRRLGKIDNSVERFGRFRAERSIRRADVVVLVLDAVQRPTAQDKKIASMVLKESKGCVVLVNKWDLEDATQRQYGPHIARTMPFMEFCPVVFASALSGYNIRRSVEAIDHVASQVKAELPTGILNRTLQNACSTVAAPSLHGRPFRIYYATQVGTAPLTVRLFVNRPRDVPPAYQAYLIRSLRTTFGLEGAPILLQFRARHPTKN